MSSKELSRVHVMEQLKAKRLTQAQAAEQLGRSVRQVKRLWRAYRLHGAKGLLSRKRGQPSHHRLSPALEELALGLLQAHYADFGPTLAHEKLTEIHHLPISRESVRRLMIQDGLWKPHRHKRPVFHPLRERRARRGELVQVDGSPFDWFEGRAPACTLLVFIDDATGEILHLFFTEAESTFSYMEATEQYLRQQGKPLAFYSDKLSVFRQNQPALAPGQDLTQFTRALQELDIELICANSPQAKGRVEKANQTLQDRLVKEMRLRGITGLAAANAFVPEFLTAFNRRFAVAPRNPQDAHRPLLPSDDLARILTVQERRVLSKNLTLQYKRTLYQIQTPRPRYALRNACVVVRENRHGEVTIEYKGRPLAYTIYHRPVRQAEIVTSKELNRVVDQVARPKRRRKATVPPPNHPWRKFKIHPWQADQPPPQQGTFELGETR